MTKKIKQPWEYAEAADVAMFRTVGEHVGDGWVCLDLGHAHPRLQSYFRGGLVHVAKLADTPMHTRVRLVYTPTKNSMKLVDYEVQD